MKEFRHSCATIYHCYNCKKRFKCKRENTKQEKQKREEEYKKTKTVPKCNLCNQNHWRCLHIKCEQCCKLNKCNEIGCINCIEGGIECKRTFPRSKEEFEDLYKDLTYFSGKFERSETGRLHAQIYFQLKNRVSLKKIKEIFDDDSMSLPNYLVKDSDYNRDYSLKKFYKCKEHKNCKCDYMNTENICEFCNVNCVRNLAILPGTVYDVGIWEFGEYRYFDAYNKGGCEEINDFKLDDLRKMEYIKKNNISYEEVVKNSTLQPICWYSSPNSHKLISLDYKSFTKKNEYISKYKPSDFNITKEMQQWVDENLLKKPDRPKSLLLVGGSRLGKTEWVRSLGKHVYWNSTHNLSKWDDDSDYIVLDDFKWNWRKNENMTTRIDGWKGIIGCQKEFEMTDKYQHKRTIKGPKPCIILSNQDQDPLNAMRVDGYTKGSNEYEDLINLREWFLSNVIVVYIHKKLFNDCDNDNIDVNHYRDDSNNDNNYIDGNNIIQDDDIIIINSSDNQTRKRKKQYINDSEGENEEQYINDSGGENGDTGIDNDVNSDDSSDSYNTRIRKKRRKDLLIDIESM
jgi:hypothetical protein